MQQFIIEYKAVFLTFHLLSMAIGIGGATVSDILFFKFLKDFKISQKEAEVLNVLKDIILTAMFFIIVTGALLFLGNPTLQYSPAFLVKSIAAVILTINGICLHVFIAPYLVRLNLRGHSTMSRGWYHLAFALGAVSICSWYSILFIAGIKSLLPANFALLLSGYLSIVCIGIIGSQLFEVFLRKKASQK